MDIITKEFTNLPPLTLGIELIGSVFELPKTIKKTNTGRSKQIATLIENSPETIKKIICEFFEERVLLLISGNVTTQDIILRSLREYDFYKLTGTNNTQFQLLREEKSKFKYLTPSLINEALIQNTRVQLTHLVDHKINPLSELKNIPNRFLFRPEIEDAKEHRAHQNSIQLVYSWESIYHIIREDSQSIHHQEECEKDNIFLGAAS